MSAYSFLEETTAQAQHFIENEAKEVRPEELGLDKRAGWKLYITSDAIITPKGGDRTLQYYGGFEYVDKSCRQEAGDYVFYFNEDSRVADHLETYEERELDKAIDISIAIKLEKEQNTD